MEGNQIVKPSVNGDLLEPCWTSGGGRDEEGRVLKRMGCLLHSGYVHLCPEHAVCTLSVEETAGSWRGTPCLELGVKSTTAGSNYMHLMRGVM